MADFTIFDCQDFNLLKVVLDGLRVEYEKKGLKSATVLQSSFFLETLFFMKRMKHIVAFCYARKMLTKVGQIQKKHLLLDNGRSILNEKNKKVSYYFEKIKSYLHTENCFMIMQSYSEVEHEYSMRHFTPLKFSSICADDRKLHKQLKQTFKKIKDANIFSPSELTDILTAFSYFFLDYRMWRRIAAKRNFRQVFFDQHYHREGMMLALRRAGIKTIELQHGLIAKEDIFYVFPHATAKIIKKALFPDKILTYGNYWKDVLKTGCEFREDQIEIIGIYQEINLQISVEQRDEFVSFVTNSDFILITTQTYLHNYFIEYTSWLSTTLVDKKSELRIVLKLHPAEDRRVYESISELGNVKIMDCNTNFLLSRCKYHISIYSTTLFDALKYDCVNFSLNVAAYRDYIDGLIDIGVSTLLELDEDPCEKDVGKSKLRTDYIFEDFELNKEKLLKL